MSGGFLVALPPVNPCVDLLFSPRVSHDDFFRVHFLSPLLLPETADEEEEEDEDGHEAAADRGVHDGGRIEAANRVRRHLDPISGDLPISRATFQRAGRADVAAGAREIARSAVGKRRSGRHVVAIRKLAERRQRETVGMQDTRMVFEIALAELARLEGGVAL